MTQPTANSPQVLPVVGVPKHLMRSRALVACSGPLAIAGVVLIGLLVSKSFNIGYRGEMIAAAVVSLAAALIAVAPLIALMGRGVVAILRLTMLATLLRVIVMLIGLYLAMGPGWKLSLMPLVIWSGSCYFAMLVAESAATAWVVKHG